MDRNDRGSTAAADASVGAGSDTAYPGLSNAFPRRFAAYPDRPRVYLARAGLVVRDRRPHARVRERRALVGPLPLEGRLHMDAEVERVERDAKGLSFVVGGSYATKGYAFFERAMHRGRSAGFFRRTWRDAGDDETLDLVAEARDRREDLSDEARAIVEALEGGGGTRDQRS